MKTIYDYFKNFESLEKNNFLIVKDKCSAKNIIFFRIFYKKSSKYEYIGVTFIPPEIIDTDASYFVRENIHLNLFENVVTARYIPVIESILRNYLKNEVRNNLDVGLKK